MNSEINVLIVDDFFGNLELLSEVIREAGYIPRTAESVQEAIKAIEEQIPQLILSDISMPDIDGFEFCEILKSNPQTRDIPVIFASAIDSMEEKAKGFQVGAVDYITKPFNFDEAINRVTTHVQLYIMKNELEDYNKKLHVLVQNQIKIIVNSQKSVIFALAKLGELRDDDTGNHLIRISKYSKILAENMQYVDKFSKFITPQFIEEIESAAQLHDIGKVAIPDDVILKPGKLTEKERQLINTHSEIGGKTLMEVYKGSDSNQFISMAIDIAYYHHERWDGKGYPKGLKGEEIPLSARIVALSDVYDALTTKRIYKEGYTKQESSFIIREESGKMFDPDIVDVFLKIREQFEEVVKEYVDFEERI